jgi:hypothetical protein
MFVFNHFLGSFGVSRCWRRKRGRGRRFGIGRGIGDLGHWGRRRRLGLGRGIGNLGQRRWGRGGGLRGGRFRGLAKKQKVAKGALVHAVKASFVAVEEAEGVGFRKGVERGCEAAERIGFGIRTDLVVHEAGLDGPGAAEAPVREGHLFDYRQLDAAGWRKTPDVLVHDIKETCARFALEDDVAGEEAVAGSVPGGATFAIRGDRTAGAGAIGAGRLDLFECWHMFGGRGPGAGAHGPGTGGQGPGTEMPGRTQAWQIAQRARGPLHGTAG